MKFIVFTTDIPPIPGVPTSGTALRTFGLVQGLRGAGHEVSVSVPRSALDGFKKREAKTGRYQNEIAAFAENAFDAANQADLIEQSGADAVLCGHWPAFATGSKPRIPVIIDLAGPHLLERHYQGSSNQQGAILGKLNALNRADYFIVSGAKQRLYFLSYLLRAKVNAPEARICTIPMPLPPQTPELRKQVNAEYPRFVFGGVFLPWQDPSFALRQVASEVLARARGNFTCIGGQHPNYPIREGIYKKLFEELSQNPRVVVKPMLPYEEFIDVLSGQDVAVDLMKWNLERELAVTIRSTTYLWAGVPVIYNSYADLGSLIERYDAGWLVPPENPGALSAVLDEIYTAPERVLQKAEAAQRLARECFSWDHAAAQLLSLIGTARQECSQEVDIILDFPQNAELRLTQAQPVEQGFTCRVDGLRKVEFRIATHGVLKPAACTAELLLDGSGEIVASARFEDTGIQNNEWHALEFEPLRTSAGRNFILRLRSEELDQGRAISPWACNDSPYPLRQLQHGNTSLKGRALCVRTTCQHG